MLVRPDRRAIQNEPFQIGVLEGLEDPLPDPFFGPAIVPLPDGAPLAKAFGQIAPRGTGLADPKNGINEETVILGGYAGVAGLAGEEILDAIPVFILNLVAAQRQRSWGGNLMESLLFCSKLPEIVYTP